MAFFPNYTESQLPDRDFMFSIVSTLYPNSLKELIDKAREKRSLGKNVDQDELIEIDPDILEAIMSTLSMKSKFELLITFIATHGRAAFMLKKEAKLIKKKANYKKNDADLKKFSKNNEEDIVKRRKNDDTNVDNPNRDEESKEEDDFE